MDPGKIFQIITNSTLLATRLLPGAGGPVQFSEARYCVLLAEDSPPAITVAKVTAVHKEGARVRYRITGGNRDGLFTINRRSGLITLAAPLDYELHPKHELVVAAEAEGKMGHTIVQVTVADVNDNPPQFLESELMVTVVEEDDTGLPAGILKIVAQDDDIVDQGRLVYSIGGDGVDGYSARDAYFNINPHTGELMQLRALDRDPPRGRETWRVKVQVRDGQRSTASSSSSSSSYRRSQQRYPRVPHYRQPQQPRPPVFSMNFRYLEGIPYPSGADQSRSDSEWDLQQNEAEAVSFDHRVMTSLSKSSLRGGITSKGHEKRVDISQKKRRAVEKRRKFKDIRKRNSQERGRKSILNSAGIIGLIDESRLRKMGSSLRSPSSSSSIPQRYLHRASKQDSQFLAGLPKERWIEEEGEEEEDFTTGTNWSNANITLQRTVHDPTPSVGRHSTNGEREQSVPIRRFSSLWGKQIPHGFKLKYAHFKNKTSVPEETNLSFQRMEGASEVHPTVGTEGEETWNARDVTSSFNSSLSHRTESGEGQTPVTTAGYPDEDRMELIQRQKRNLEKRYAIDRGGCKEYGESQLDTSDGTRSRQPYGGEVRHGYGGHTAGYDGGGGDGGDQRRREKVHVAETIVTVTVKDINDNAPAFPNATIFGEVQENGPIDLSVAVVSAWDADDEAEGTNAIITYSIEKNVIDELSGQAIFAVHPETGLVRTVICCLDRETTPEYHIQVVAIDGGGLKGTGTVVVRLADVNDNSPRLTRELWQVEVNETWAAGPPNNATLVELSTVDHDTSNYFFYRVVKSSGWGWEHFAVRTHGTIGELYANKTLDYEDPAHRRGFRFMVQVTDRGRGGWSESRHTDTAWVAIQLKDLNDNPPEFRRPHVHITVREDTPPGTLLATLPARDPDMSGQQKVKYHVWAAWGALTVDTGGGVRLWRSLDREAPGGEKAIAKIIGVDEGIPPLTSTATLTITVTDVNDCPPRLIPPTVLHIREGVSSSKLGMLTATDDDVWALGHGPPFNLSLAPTNPEHVLQLIALKYDPTVDSGRGGAEIWTLGPIDREEYPQLTAEIIVSDAGGLAAAQPVTVIIDDVNDNPMKPAAKTVYLWKMQGGGVDADIGRVYVKDPDDWDLDDKTFSWVSSPHPLFTLNPNTGAIYASTQVREGRYELQFSVFDRVWRQKNVSANVTVDVRYLSPEALAHAVPVTLTPTTPAQVTSGWTPKRGGGGLGLLSAAVTKVVNQDPNSVEIVSVYGHPSSSEVFHATSYPVGAFSRHGQPPPPQGLRAPFACVWVSVRKNGGGYIDPIKLQGLLALHIQQLEDVMKLRVLLEEPTREGEAGGNGDEVLPEGVSDPSSIASMASTSLRLQVVDTNSTSLVTPRLTRALDCRAHIRDADDSCTATSCLNGGRCVRTDKGNRCICPGGSSGRRCKITSRTFKGGGWAWVRPLPPCLPTTLSLRLLTMDPEALLLYSGPLASTSPRPRQPPAAMMALQLVDGRPQVILEGVRGPVKLEVDAPLNTGSWHSIHLHLNTQGLTLMVDHCGRGWASNSTSDAHCLARAAWPEPQVNEAWISSVPLQVGGLAHPYPHPHLFGWTSAPIQQGLNGCISNLKINTQLIDLGEPAFSSGSDAKCTYQNSACDGGCGFRGRCTGGLREPTCDCNPGWSGPKCASPTVPLTLGHGSFARLTLSFTPDPYAITTQLRLRTQGRSDGLLLQMAAQSRPATLAIRLRGGVACALVSGPPEMRGEVCVEDFFLGDGSWHTVYVTRYGYDLSISVDDGDGWRHNGTLTSFLSAIKHDGMQQDGDVVPPVPFEVEQEEGVVSVGGDPEYVDSNLVTVHHDLTDSCIDDVRVSGHPLPLPPSENGSDWGQVTTFQHVDTGCLSPDLCVNTSCLPPLSCHQSWRHTTCSCGPGGHLLGGICQDIDECVYQPCLHGGSCTNLYPGYQCTCNHGTTGYNCEWHHLPTHSQHLTPPMAIAALTLSVLVLVLMGVLLTIWIHRSRAGRGGALRQTGVESETDVGSVMGVIETPLSTQDAHSLASKEEMTLLESLKIRLPTKSISPEGTKQPISSISSVRLPEESMLTKDVSVIIPVSTAIPPSVKRSPTTDSILIARGKSFVGGSTVPLSSSKSPHVVAVSGVSSTQPLLAQDDLRAYAYEGDGSPSGSLTSTVLGLRRESLEENNVKPLMPEYGEVLDLLKTLPDAVGSPVVPPEAHRCRIEGDNTFHISRGQTVPPSGPKDICEAISRTSSQCSVGGLGIGVVSVGNVVVAGVGVGNRGPPSGTLPHRGVQRAPIERKASLTEFSTMC